MVQLNHDWKGCEPDESFNPYRAKPEPTRLRLQPLPAYVLYIQYRCTNCTGPGRMSIYTYTYNKPYLSLFLRIRNDAYDTVGL